MTMTEREYRQQLLELEALAQERRLDADEEAVRRDLIVGIYDEQRLEARYDMAHAQAMEDPTGQDLDDFYGEDR